jgi:hypothetical protein
MIDCVYFIVKKYSNLNKDSILYSKYLTISSEFFIVIHVVFCGLLFCGCDGVFESDKLIDAILFAKNVFIASID